MSELDNLQKLDWLAVPNTTYIMKYQFHDTGYNIMVSDLTFLYSEKLTEENILERFSELNPFAQMKIQVILENLKKSLQKCLTEKTELSIKMCSDKLIVSLQFPVKHVLCNYDIKMDLMGADKVTQYIIGPTVLSALLSQKKILELQKKILSSEISNSSSNTAVSSQNILDPDLLMGKNIPTETLLGSFLKIQSHFKDLHAENYESYSTITKEKSKVKSSVHSVSPHKKFKIQENLDNEATSIKFEDGDERISIKEELTEYDDIPSQPEKNALKKKKVFKI